MDVRWRTDVSPGVATVCGWSAFLREIPTGEIKSARRRIRAARCRNRAEEERAKGRNSGSRRRVDVGDDTKETEES
jgi:hypothetical protein